MKQCPFCAEEIQDAAIKCKHCDALPVDSQEFCFVEEKSPWYFRSGFIVFALLSVGPLALPLIWWRPNSSPGTKTALTVAILVMSWVLYLVMLQSVNAIREYALLLESL